MYDQWVVITTIFQRKKKTETENATWHLYLYQIVWRKNLINKNIWRPQFLYSLSKVFFTQTMYISQEILLVSPSCIKSGFCVLCSTNTSDQRLIWCLICVRVGHRRNTNTCSYIQFKKKNRIIIISICVGAS